MRVKPQEAQVIIGLQRTFYDERASLRIWGLCDEVMSLLAKEWPLKYRAFRLRHIKAKGFGISRQFSRIATYFTSPPLQGFKLFCRSAGRRDTLLVRIGMSCVQDSEDGPKTTTKPDRP